MRRFRTAGGAGVLAVAALALAPTAAWAHAEMSPPVAEKGVSQIFTLAVPTEKDNATTTKVELQVPSGFAIDSYEPSPGWKRSVQASGSGEEAVVHSVTWSGGHVPAEEDAVFRFLGDAEQSGSKTFKVVQTYSDGSVVSWTGAESSQTPAPTVDFRSDLGGGGGSSTLSIIALAVAVLAAVLAVASMLTGGGRRSLT